MKHVFVKKNLSAYLDSELSKERRQEIASHLKSCESCRKELREIQKGKAITTYFEEPDWQGTERLWKIIQRSKISTPEKRSSINSATRHLAPLEKLIHPRPAFVIAILVILLGVNLFINLKRDRSQYQQPRLDWTPSYAFDYGLYLDALIAGMPPMEFERRYESQRASYEQARSQATFRLASFTRMPETFQLREVRLLKNACCRSVQFDCSNNSSDVIIFQQPKGHPVTFGNYPLERFHLNGQLCHRVKAGRWTALSWEGQDSQFVAIGEINDAEMAAIIFAVTPS